MTIETKYNVGDEVWSICECKAYKFTIRKINIKRLSFTTFVEYYLTYITEEPSTDDDISREIDIPEPYLEQHLFPTKEELLKSL